MATLSLHITQVIQLNLLHSWDASLSSNRGFSSRAKVPGSQRDARPILPGGLLTRYHDLESIHSQLLSIRL